MVVSLVRIESIKKSFKTRKGQVIKAIDGVSLNIREGEILGLLGSSGSGKTTLARILTGLEKADEGNFCFQNTELIALSIRNRRKFCSDIQMIFQDPYSSMSRRQRIYNILAEPLVIQKYPKPYMSEVCDMLSRVGLSESFLYQYPFELSGGERQRVAIARSLILKPRFVIADEIVSMLDSSRKVGILNLLLELRSEMELSVLFITHDITVAGYICDRIAVMHKGKIVEMGDANQVLNHPTDPYTSALIEAIPIF